MECTKCNFKTTDQEGLIFHFKLFHKYDNEFECNFCSPKRFFSKFYTFQTHLKSKHTDTNVTQIEIDSDVQYCAGTQQKLPLCVESSSHLEKKNNDHILTNNNNSLDYNIDNLHLNLVNKIYCHQNICRSNIQDIFENFFAYQISLNSLAITHFNELEKSNCLNSETASLFLKSVLMKQSG